MYRESRVKIDGVFDLDEFGKMTAKAKIARIGVQTYLVNGKEVKEFRSEEEVRASVDSFNNRPVTLNHPMSKFVDSNNAQNEMKGFITDAYFEDGWMIATIHITHKDAVIAAQTTHGMFSNGYSANVEILDSNAIWTDELGVMGERGASYEYNAVQRDISGNHVALVMNPRAGKQATFIADSIDDVIIIDTESVDNQKQESLDMTKEKNETKNDNKEVFYSLVIGDNSYEIGGSDAKAIVQEVNALIGKVDGLELAASEAQSQLDTLKNQKVDEDVIANEIASRTAIWDLVKPHLDSEIDYTLNELEVKKLYLKSVAPNLASKIDSADESYIQGIWDIKQPAPKNDAEELNKKVLEAVDSKQDSGEQTPKTDDLEELRRKYQESRNNYFQ